MYNKNVGIVCEYNPLHNGHKYQMDSIRSEFSNNTKIICLMSSNFLQRGEPAIIDKYSRAVMACKAGADIVLEYPSIFSCRSAEDYAFNAMYIFSKLNIITDISYGSKSTHTNSVRIISQILSNEPEQFKQLLKEYLSKGLSFPEARQKAFISYLKIKELHLDCLDDISDTLNSPNDILAIEYEKAKLRLQASFGSFPIARKGADYNNQELFEDFSSATAIRNNILTNKSTDLTDNNMPKSSVEILNEYAILKYFLSIEDFSNEILYSILQKSEKQLQSYPLVNEGLENLLKKHVNFHDNISPYISAISSKRYARTRIQRLLTHILLGLDYKLITTYKSPLYIRVLACTDKQLLSQIASKSSLPVIVSLNRFYESANKKTKQLIDFENRCCDIYSHAALKNKSNYISEFSQMPYIL